MGMPVRKDLRSPMRFADFSMVFVAVAISILGVLMNYAATWRLLEFNGGDPASIAKRQAVFVVLGLIVMAGTATIDYRVYRDFASQGYLIVLVMLVGVLFFGRRINGARSWFEVPGVPIQLQPSEFAKVAVILALAAFVANHDGYLKLDALVNALLLGGAHLPPARHWNNARVCRHPHGDVAGRRSPDASHCVDHCDGRLGDFGGVQRRQGWA